MMTDVTNLLTICYKTGEKSLKWNCLYFLPHRVTISFDIQNDNKAEPKHQTQHHSSNVLNAALTLKKYTYYIEVFDILYSQKHRAVNPPV